MNRVVRFLGMISLVAFIGCGSDTETDPSPDTGTDPTDDMGTEPESDMPPEADMAPDTDNNTECSTGLPNGLVSVELSGGFTSSDSIGIECGIRTADPYQVTSQVIPDGLGVPPYFELRLQDDTEWAMSVRFGGDLTEGTMNVLVRTEQDPGPPLGFGWFAEPVETAGYNWDVTTGSLELTDVNATGQNSVTLLTGTATVSFGGESAIEAQITLTEFPVIVQ